MAKFTRMNFCQVKVQLQVRNKNMNQVTVYESIYEDIPSYFDWYIVSILIYTILLEQNLFFS